MCHSYAFCLYSNAFFNISRVPTLLATNYKNLPFYIIMTSIYNYEPLAEDGSIRLLKLLPGSLQTPLQGALITVSLSGPKIHFDALSYCWGNPFDKAHPFYDHLIFYHTRSFSMDQFCESNRISAKRFCKCETAASTYGLMQYA